MDTHCPPLCSTVLTTHHPHWDIQEDASHQAMHSTQPFRPREYPRLSSNLTELSLQFYEVPNHLVSQSQQQLPENYTPPEFFKPKPSFPGTNQQEVLNSSSGFQAQHVQSYLSFKPNNYKSIAASFTGSNSSSANATELKTTPFYEDLQAYSERPQVLNARNRQIESLLPPILPASSTPEYQLSAPRLASDCEHHGNAQPLLSYHTESLEACEFTPIESTDQVHEHFPGHGRAPDKENEENPYPVGQSHVNVDTAFPIMDTNPSHLGPRADLEGLPFYLEWQQFNFADGTWKYVI
ncbi:hypothetical protein MYU51_000013 [Penicillium brevicompactum]